MADAVDWECAGGAASLAGSLEEVETAQTAIAGSSSVARVARIGAVGADSTSRSDNGVSASGAVAVGSASCAARSTGNAFLQGVIVELEAEAAFLAD